MSGQFTDLAARGRAGLRHPWLAVRTLNYYGRRAIADVLARWHVYPYPHRIIFLAGMGMGGSTWLKTLLAGIPGYYSRRMRSPFDVQYRQDICDRTFSSVPKWGYSLFKTHLNPTDANLEVLFRNGVEKIVVIHRDPRDVAVGRYHRLVAVPKRKDAPDFIDYEAMGKERALDDSIQIVAGEFVWWIQTWLRLARLHPGRILVVKFEALRADPARVFKEVLAFYGIHLNDRKVAKILARAAGRRSFKKNWAAAKVLPFGLSSNFRSGRVGQWRTEMTPRQIELCGDLLGDPLIELGYERDLDWNQGST